MRKKTKSDPFYPQGANQNANSAPRHAPPLSAEQEAQVLAILDQLKHEEGALLPILHAIQDALSYIPEAAVPHLANTLNLSRAEVHGVISFYHYFRTQPPGKHIVEICRAESCQAKGGRALEAKAKASLGIDWHQTSADGQFTLEPIYCLGNCACSPSVRVGSRVLGRVNETKLEALIDELSHDPVQLVASAASSKSSTKVSHSSQSSPQTSAQNPAQTKAGDSK